MRLPTLLVAAAALIAAGLGAATARAEPARPLVHRRVVLISMPDPVFSATAAALGPWSIAVEATDQLAPVSDLDAARAAHRFEATALTWFEGDVLVIYDHLRGASERQLAQPPIDDITAAAVALSIKTALRRPVVVAVVPLPDREPDPDPVLAPPVPPPPRPRRLHLAGHLGVGLRGASSPGPLLQGSLRLSVGLSITPGLAVIAELGGARLPAIETPALSGAYRELGAGLGAEWRRLVGELAVTPSGLVIVQASHLAGTLPSDRPVSSSLTSVGLQLGLSIDRKVGPIQIGPLVTAQTLLSPIRFQVQGADVLVVPRFSAGLALRIAY